MKKVLVIIEIPSIKQKYEIMIPKHLVIAEIIPMLVSGVEKLSNHEYISSGSEILCHKEMELILGSEFSIDEYEIMNGDHLILM